MRCISTPAPAAHFNHAVHHGVFGGCDIRLDAAACGATEMKSSRGRTAARKEAVVLFGLSAAGLSSSIDGAWHTVDQRPMRVDRRA